MSAGTAVSSVHIPAAVPVAGTVVPPAAVSAAGTVVLPAAVLLLRGVLRDAVLLAAVVMNASVLPDFMKY